MKTAILNRPVHDPLKKTNEYDCASKDRIYDIELWRGFIMRTRNENALLKALLGAGLYLLDPLRDRFSDRIDDWSDRAHAGYDEASERVARAGRAIRGEDRSGLGTAAALLVGVGVGVAVGLLFAPASGEETRNNISDRVQNLGDRVRSRVSSEGEGATGTYR